MLKQSKLRKFGGLNVQTKTVQRSKHVFLKKYLSTMMSILNLRITPPVLSTDSTINFTVMHALLQLMQVVGD